MTVYGVVAEERQGHQHRRFGLGRRRVSGNASSGVDARGVQVETREALVPDMSRDLCRPGFSDEQQPGGGGDRARPSKRIMRKGGYRAPKKSERKFKL